MHARNQRVPFNALLHQLLGDQRGAAIVEAAFAFPIVIFLSLGALETARAVSASASMNHAAKEVARWAAVRGEASNEEATEAELETRAIELANLPASSVTARVRWEPDNSPGSLVFVEMEHAFTPVALPFLPKSLALSSTASMTVIR